MSPAFAILQKEAGELLVSRRGVGWLLSVSAALSVFSLLFVGDVELSLLDNAQVVYDMAGVITALGAMLCLVAGVDAVAGERERGTLLPLLLTPVGPWAVIFGKLGAQLLAWGVMLVLSLPYLWAVGSSGQNLESGIAVLLILGTPVVIGFGFAGLALGAFTGSPRSALMSGMILLVVAASPLLVGASLRQTGLGQIFDAIDPISYALNAYDDVIIDSSSIVEQLGRLAAAMAWLALSLAAAACAFARYALRMRSA